MASITLKYQSGVQSLTLNVMWIKGHAEFEDVEFHNSLQNKSDDGVYYEMIDAYRRVITINFGVVLDSGNRAFIVAWMLDRTRTVTYLGSEIAVVPYDDKGFANTWWNNLSFAKALTLKFRERNTTVASGSGYPPGSIVAVSVARSGIAVTANTNNPIVFPYPFTSVPVVTAFALSSDYSNIGDNSSIVPGSITRYGFLFNPSGSGLLSYMAMDTA